MSVKKSIRKILNEPAEMELREISNILIFLGYKLDRIKGSHYNFKRNDSELIVIPSHNKRVKKIYVKKIKKKLYRELLSAI